MSETQTKRVFDKEATVNKSNSIKRIRADYNSPWIGLLRETIQNSVDGWGFNRLKGNLEDSQNLKVEFIVDTDAHVLTIKDNAGGMNRETFEQNLLAIDNPSDDKADGNGAGSYGRGFWVIMSCGQVAEIETHHETGMFSSAVTTEGKYVSIEELDEPEIGNGNKGTFYEIHDIRDEDMVYLSDWEKVETALIENFTPLLNDDSITVEYTIDGETHIPNAPNLKQLQSEYAICEEPELKPFTYHDEEHKIQDFTMIDATQMEDEPPWKGVILYKGNDYLDYPFMKVDSYDPRGVPSMTNPVKMFGWCDASDLCRPRKDGNTLENNAHNEIQLSRIGDKTNLQMKVYDVHDEHFKDKYTTEEKSELLNGVRDSVNSILSEMDSFSDLSSPDQYGSGSGPSSSSSPSSPSLSFFRCNTNKYRVDVEDDITIGVEFNPEDTLEFDKYQICNVEVKNTTEDEVVYEGASFVFELTPNEPLEQIIDILSFEDEGRYVFSADVKGYTDDENNEIKDSSQTTFIVGEVEDEKEETTKDSEGSVEFITDISPYASDPNEHGRAFVQPAEDGGLKLNVNTNWPSFVQAKNNYRGDEFEQKQKELFRDWGFDAVLEYWERNELEDLNASSDILDVHQKSASLREELDKAKVSLDE